MANSRTPARPHDAVTGALARQLASHLPPRGEATIAIGYSGGLDSTVLLHAAAQLLGTNTTRLVALHIHHGLSGHADAWARHCVAQSAKFNIRCEICRVTVEAGNSLEAKAREARYAALVGWCQEQHVAVLATAHHADDQAETVLFNLLRGSGLAGLRGVAASMPVDAVQLIRPLLELTRAALMQYARHHALRWIEDESNLDTRFTRNALRLHVLPALVEVNAHAVAGINTMARHAKTATRLLDQLAAIDLGQADSTKALLLEPFRQLNHDRRANVLRFWIKSQGMTALSEAALQQWLTQIERGSQTLCLTHDGLDFVVRDDALAPREGATSTLAWPQSGSASALRWQGEPELALPQWRGAIAFKPVVDGGISVQRLRDHALTVQPRVGGERIQIEPHKPSRSLKNLYQEAGISAAARGQLPLFYLGETLVYAAGLGMNLRACESDAEDNSERLVLHWRDT